MFKMQVFNNLKTFFLGYVNRTVLFYYFAHITGMLLVNVLLNILDKRPTEMFQ